MRVDSYFVALHAYYLRTAVINHYEANRVLPIAGHARQGSEKASLHYVVEDVNKRTPLAESSLREKSAAWKALEESLRASLNSAPEKSSSQEATISGHLASIDRLEKQLQEMTLGRMSSQPTGFQATYVRELREVAATIKHDRDNLDSMVEIVEMKNTDIARVAEDALIDSQLARRLVDVRSIASGAASAAYDRLSGKLETIKTAMVVTEGEHQLELDEGSPPLQQPVVQDFAFLVGGSSRNGITTRDGPEEVNWQVQEMKAMWLEHFEPKNVLLPWAQRGDKVSCVNRRAKKYGITVYGGYEGGNDLTLTCCICRLEKIPCVMAWRRLPSQLCFLSPPYSGRAWRQQTRLTG
ncbi:hypothetical protein VE03_00186 [Pseudogymnoascus sp. 23342-1-I1]|nr:hypothetical protein VE03_00186 [Pseudogymnoascus sp. 23342-1-I1]